MKKSIYMLLIILSLWVPLEAKDRNKNSTDKQLQKIKTKINKIAQKGAIQIYAESPATQNLGYNLGNMVTNGEYSVISQFIKQGDIVVDAGANWGDWSKEVISHCKDCDIYGFEPAPDAFEIFKTWAAPYDNVRRINKALSDEEGEAEINWYPNSGGTTFFHRPILINDFKMHYEKIMVPTISLDIFCDREKISHINFLKIDTEGAEAKIIAGARSLISHHAIDFIQFEYGGTYPDAHIKLEDIYNFLQANNYFIFRIIPDGLVYVPHWIAHLENSTYSNYLAVSNTVINS